VVGGTTTTSDVIVSLGGGDQRAEMIVPVSTFSVVADAGARHVVTFDLRSQQWLTMGALQSGRVEDDALQSSVSATVQTERR
jgi:hypothetical protein